MDDYRHPLENIDNPDDYPVDDGPSQEENMYRNREIAADLAEEDDRRSLEGF